MLTHTFYTLIGSGVIFLIGAILLLLPSELLSRLSELANSVLLATDQKIVPFRKGIGVFFLAISAWIFYRVYLLIQQHPMLFQ